MIVSNTREVSSFEGYMSNNARKTMTVEEVKAARGGNRFTGLLKGRVTERGKMNKTETAYSKALDDLVRTGDVLWYEYEAMRFRVTDGGVDANKIWVTPDFVVMLSDATLVLDDVKGGMVDNASIVRLKVAASAFPMFRWRVVTKQRVRDGGKWDFRELSQ